MTGHASSFLGGRVIDYILGGNEYYSDASGEEYKVVQLVRNSLCNKPAIAPEGVTTIRDSVKEQYGEDL